MSSSLILPCYNPPEGWEQIICTNYNAIQKHVKGTLELIVVMDGTSKTVTDAALSVLENKIPAIKLIKYAENKGKGYAIRQGVAAATGDIIIYTDIDFPYTEESLLAIYDELDKKGCDVAIGVKDDVYYSHVPFLRRVISRILRFFIRLFLSMPITDTQCGLKGFKKSIAPLFLQTTIDRYLFDLEFVRNCFKMKKYSIRAIPVTLTENVHFRRMNYSILLPEMINFIKLLFK